MVGAELYVAGSDSNLEQTKTKKRLIRRIAESIN